MMSYAGLARGDKGHDQDLFVLDRRSGVSRAVTIGERRSYESVFADLRPASDGRTLAYVQQRGPSGHTQVLVSGCSLGRTGPASPSWRRCDAGVT